MNQEISFPTIELLQASPTSNSTGIFHFVLENWNILSGVAMFVVAFLQLVVMWRQSQIADRQTEITSRQIMIAEQQNDIAAKQATIEHQNFMATHRPRVIVRRVSLDFGSIQYPIGTGTLWKVQFIIANTGASEATILEGNATLAVLKSELPSIPPFNECIDIAKGIKLVSGYSSPIFLPLENDQIAYIRQRSMTNDPGFLYFFGYFQYIDGMGIVRRTAFCRHYNAVSKRFKAVDDSDYEYVD